MEQDTRSIGAIIAEMLRRTLDFNGRSRGKDGVVYFVATSIIALFMALAEIFREWRLPDLVDFVVNLALTAPLVAWSVRRLHDAGKTGYWALGWLLLAGSAFVFQSEAITAPLALMALVLLFVLPANVGANRFGADPRIALVDRATPFQ